MPLSEVSEAVYNLSMEIVYFIELWEERRGSMLLSQKKFSTFTLHPQEQQEERVSGEK